MPNKPVWGRVGGGTWLGPSEDKLTSDTEYEATDGRTISFQSTPDIRYSEFFPEELTEQEMEALIKSCEGRKDVVAGSIQEPELERNWELIFPDKQLEQLVRDSVTVDGVVTGKEIPKFMVVGTVHDVMDWVFDMLKITGKPGNDIKISEETNRLLFTLSDGSILEFKAQDN